VSLRLRLLLLILLALLPVAGLLVYTAAEQRRADTADARATAVRLTLFVSSSQQQLIDMTRQLLGTMATLADVRPGHARRCKALVVTLLKQYPRYANLGAFTPDGDVFCTAMPLGHSINVTARNFFRRAVETRDFAVGDYMIGRITDKPVIVFAQPVLSEAGQVLAVVFAALDLRWLGQLVAEAQMPAESTVTILDRNGLVLAQYPRNPEAIGRPVDPSLRRLIMGASGVGTTEALGPDGAPYLFAFSALGYRQEPIAFVSVGVSKAVAFASADRLLRRTLIVLGAVVVLTLVTAWVGSNLVLLRRVRALVGATQRLSAGDLTARSGVGGGSSELDRLARAFDQMAESLQQSEQLRRQEEELRRKNYQLEQEKVAIQQADRMKTEFVSMVSHELRTPLTSIQGYVDLLIDRSAAALGPDARESLTVVKRSADRLLGLINDLLDLSRMEAGKIELRRGPVDLPHVIQAVAASLRPLIESKRQRLALDLGEALPPVSADADRVAQILTNLVANAHRYTPVDGTITIRARSRDPLVEVEVVDTGVGLTAAEQAQLFTPFYRARPSDSRRDGGTGLGLVITRLLVELHGGRVVVSSVPGQGSTFGFSLPIAGAVASALIDERAAAARSPQAASGGDG
jgi:signal transduction histidine kinase